MRGFIKSAIETGKTALACAAIAGMTYLFYMPEKHDKRIGTRLMVLAAAANSANERAKLKSRIEDKTEEIKAAPKTENKYSSFKYPDELENILKHSKRIGVEPELLMAIRSAENGVQGREYGIIPNDSYNVDTGYTDSDGKFYEYKDEKEKQACWTAWTVKKNSERGNKSIEELAKVYAPIGAENDPEGLNKNWAGNVERFYKAFKGEKEMPEGDKK